MSEPPKMTEEQRQQMEAARKKWSERLGVPLDEVPWQVVFLSDRPLTEAQRERGRQLAQEGPGKKES